MYSSRKFLSKNLQNFVYKGPVKAVIFGLEGTIVDPGCMAPVEALKDLFSNYGIYVSITDLRNNLHFKREEFIKKIFQQRIEDITNKGAPTFTKPIEIEKIMNEYTEIQEKYFKEYNTVIQGTHILFAKIREEKIKIGITTNHNSRLGYKITDHLKKQNIKPDCFITRSAVFNGIKPSPFMIYQCLDWLNVYPNQSVIKIDDTSEGIQEGLNAGCWTIGVSKWSNYTNYQSKYDLLECSEKIRNNRERCAREKLLRSGAHFVVSDLSYVFDVIKLINEKINKGEHPIDNKGF